jgi:uncharacterized membrane protein
MTDPATAPPAPVSTKAPSYYRPLLYAILLFALVARFYHLSAQSLWLDELWTLEMAAGHGTEHQALPLNTLIAQPPDLTHLSDANSITSIWTRMDQITGPPLYPMLLRFWETIFGEGEQAVRSLSAVCSLLAVVALLFVCAPRAALWPCALMAVAGPQIVYAQETRPYALMLLLGLICIALVRRIERRGPTAPSCVVLGILLLSLLLTHYFAIGALVAIFAYAVCFTRGRVRRALLLSVIATSAAFAICWGPFMWRQIPRFSTADRPTLFLTENVGGHFFRTCWRLVTLPISLLVDQRPIPLHFAAGLLVYAAAAGLLWRRRLLPMWVLWFTAIVGLLAALDFARSTKHLEFIRYALLASPAVYVVAGELWIRPPKLAFVGHFVPTLIVLFCLIHLPRAYDTQKADYRAAAAALAASAQHGEPIVFAGPSETFAPQVLYLTISHYISQPPSGPVMLIDSPAPPTVMGSLRRWNRVWLVADPEVTDAERWLPGYHIARGRSWPVVGSVVEMVASQ